MLINNNITYSYLSMQEILTGYEKYDESGSNISIAMSIEEIEVSMRDRDPEKYGDFDEVLAKVELTLRLMRIPEYKKRARLFDLVYHAMRFIDDVVDGDTKPPLPLSDRKSLVESIMFADISEIRNPLYREMILEIQEIWKNLWVYDEMMKGISQIIISMKFDLDRIMDTDKVRSRDDLEENFHKMDIIGTIAGTAIIFWIDPRESIPLITPLWEACRVMYNLRDFWEDIVADLINIPRESLDIFGISMSDIDSVKESGKQIDYAKLPESIKQWMRSEIQKIDELLDTHQKNMEQNIRFSDNKKILQWYRNLILKKLVFPKTYTNEIFERIPRILEDIWSENLQLHNF